MVFNELVKSRRSTRKFLDKAISREVILELLEAARMAPSAGNCQAWHFYVVEDKSLMCQIQEQAHHQPFISQAPVVFVVCADFSKTKLRYGDRGVNLYSIQDTSAAIQNLMLCAESLGLGTCWVGAFDEGEVARLLSLDEDKRPVAIIPVGYSDHVGKMPSRRPVEAFTTFIND